MKTSYKLQRVITATAIMFSVTIILSQITAYGQFSSVQSGSWNNPQTWSTNPNATARPDSNSTVTINHAVSAGGYALGSYCYDLIINPNGTLSAISTEGVYIKNNLVVYGQIKPLANLQITVKGHLNNYGLIHAGGEGQILFFLYGNITNYGSFKNVTNTYFKGHNYLHEHRIRSFNDSTIRLGNVLVNDSLGTIHIDSIAYLGGNLDLNRSKLKLTVWPYNWTTKLVLDAAQIGRGTIVGNNQVIASKTGSTGRLGVFGTYPSHNTLFNSVNFNGNFLSIGNPFENQNVDMVTLENCSFTGTLADYFLGGYYGSPKAIHINGLFTNNGTIKDTEPGIDNSFGMHIRQNNGSTFINNGTISCRSVNFNGNCTFQTSSALAIKDFTASNENTIVTILSPQLFLGGSFVSGSVNFNGGTLQMPADGYLHLDNDVHSMMTQNINILANNSTIVMPWTSNNQVTIHNPRIKTLKVREYNPNQEVNIYGTAEILPEGTIVNVYSQWGKITFNGLVKNYGEIFGAPNNYLRIKIKGNLMHDGVRWSNLITTINGTGPQFIQLLHNKTITGTVEFDAMLEGTNFQWFKDGNPISNGTNRILNFGNGLNSSHFGAYHCIVNGNHSRTITVNGETATQITMIEEGFDASFPPSGWQLSTTNVNYTWMQANTSGNNFNTVDPSSMYSALCPWVAQNQDEWLITPSFSLGQGNAFIRFWAGYSTNWLSFATLKLHISTDNAKTWTQIWQAENDGQPWGWRERIIDLTSYGNQQNLKLGWQYLGNDGDLVGIDGVKLVGYSFPTSMDEASQLNSVIMSQNFPNPFINETTIRLKIEFPQRATLVLFDLTGKPLHILADQYFTQGDHQINIHSKLLSLNPGVYIYRLTTTKQQEQFKMIVN